MMTVREFKAMIKDAMGVPLSMQILIYNHKRLNDDHTLSEYGITQTDTRVLMMLNLGGHYDSITVESPKHRSPN